MLIIDIIIYAVIYKSIVIVVILVILLKIIIIVSFSITIVNSIKRTQNRSATEFIITDSKK